MMKTTKLICNTSHINRPRYSVFEAYNRRNRMKNAATDGKKFYRSSPFRSLSRHCMQKDRFLKTVVFSRSLRRPRISAFAIWCMHASVVSSPGTYYVLHRHAIPLLRFFLRFCLLFCFRCSCFFVPIFCTRIWAFGRALARLTEALHFNRFSASNRSAA